MKRAPLLLALAATTALLWHSVTPAQACSCVTPREQIENADTILLGTVAEFRKEAEQHLEDDRRLVVSRTTATIEVQRYLRGSGPKKVVVEESQGCGFLDGSLLGGEYVLMLEGDNSPFTSEGLCSGSFAIYNQYQPRPNDEPYPSGLIIQQYDAIAPIVAITGPGVAPTTNDVPTVPFAIAAVALPLAFVLAASFVFPAKVSRA